MPELLSRITTNTQIFNGKPVIRDMYISVETILDLLSQGASREEILSRYPMLEPEDLNACLAYAKTVIASESKAKKTTKDFQYRYLEPKPYKRTKQLGIKGRNMTVWNLVATMRTEGFTVKETAEGFALPVEAVLEALEYYKENKEMIEAENAESGLELGLL